MLVEIPLNTPGRVFRSPMPFSRYDHGNVWEEYLRHQISLVVVLAEKQEYLVHAGRDLVELYLEEGLEVELIPVQDFQVPADLKTWHEGLQKVVEGMQQGSHAVVHCLAGLGRTGVFLACLSRIVLGLDGLEAIQWVRSSLPGALENPRQEKFVIEFQTQHL